MDDPDDVGDGRDGTTPVTVHLPSDRVEQIQRVVDEGDAESFSAWVTEAVEDKARNEHIGATETLNAKAAGVLWGDTGTADVIDASVVVVARDNPAAVVVTSDPDDMRRLEPKLDVEVC